MQEHEQQKPSEIPQEPQIEEIDPDYITGGATVVSPESTEGLTPMPHTQECNCGKFSPNESGKCGAPICENCIHAMKTSKDSPTAYCEKQFITIS